MCAVPMAAPFFDHNGLLFLPLKEVQATTQQLFKAQPFLGALAADPSLRGIMDSLSTVLLGVSQGQAKLADMDSPWRSFGQVLAAAANGRTDYLSWRALITGAPPRPEEIRRFIEVKPQLDFRRAGARPARQRRDPRRRARAGPDAGAWRAGAADRRVPLSDEEFGTLTDRVWLMVSAMMGGRAADPVAGAALLQDHLRHPGDPVRGPGHHHGAGPVGGGRVQHHLHRLHRPVRGTGGGFRHPVLGALPQRAFHHPDLAEALATPGAAWACPWRWRPPPPRRASSPSCPPPIPASPNWVWSPASAWWWRSSLSITLLPALLMLLKPPGAKRGCGLHRLAPAGRFPGAAPHDGAAHRGAASGVVCLVLTVLPALRFQSAGSAQPEGGIGLHPVRPDEKSADLAQHHRCAGAVAGRTPIRWRRASARSRWWPRR